MNKFRFFEIFGEIDPAFVSAADEILEREGQTPVPFTRRKILGAALLAAILTALLTATAYAAGLFQLWLRFPEKGETRTYSFTVEESDGNLRAQRAEIHAGLILCFDSQREGTLCAFRPGWLPTEPTHAFSLAEKAGDLARARLGMPLPPTNGEEQSLVDAEAEKVLQEMGLSREEAARWSLWCDGESLSVPDTPEGAVPPGGGTLDIPYQITLSDCSELYQLDLLVGSDGDLVELLQDETVGEERTLWFRVSKETRQGEGGPEDARFPYHVVLRYSQAEGWLLQVTGTLDPETLDKIAADTEIRQTAFYMESERTERTFGRLLLAGG